MNITPEMIAAGKAAYWGNFESKVGTLDLPADECFTNQIKVIYEAMEQAWITEARKLPKYIPVNRETHSHR